jgi:hypothetical protein
MGYLLVCVAGEREGRSDGNWEERERERERERAAAAAADEISERSKGVAFQYIIKL